MENIYPFKYPEVDVVTAANNIKKLLTLALTTSQGLSMFVHPVGRSLLIDNFDIHKWLLNPQVTIHIVPKIFDNKKTVPNQILSKIIPIG